MLIKRLINTFFRCYFQFAKFVIIMVKNTNINSMFTLLQNFSAKSLFEFSLSFFFDSSFVNKIAYRQRNRCGSCAT